MSDAGGNTPRPIKNAALRNSVLKKMTSVMLLAPAVLSAMEVHQLVRVADSFSRLVGGRAETKPE